MIGSLYRSGGTPLHAMPAGAKLGGLFVLGGALFLTGSLPLLAAAALAAAAAVAAARVPWATARRQLAAPALIVLAVVAANALLISATQAGVVGLRLAALVLAGYAVTLTTRTSEMIAVLEALLRPLERLGIADPAKASLAVALAIRFVPAVFAHAAAVREAQAARGLQRNVLALVVPVAVRALKSADDIAAAIDARGFPPLDTDTKDTPQGGRP